MLELDNGFDEAALGFGKFTRFLRQAHDHEVVNLQKQEGGNYEVSLPGTERVAQPVETPAAEAPAAGEAAPSITLAMPTESAPSGLGLRRGSTRKRHDAGAPTLFEGQVAAASGRRAGRGAAATFEASPQGQTGAAPVDLEQLGLPRAPDEQIRYLTGYRGVGRKTAEALVEGFGENLFGVLLNEPQKLEAVVPAGRAEQVLEGWKQDYLQRTGRAGAAPADEPDAEPASFVAAPDSPGPEALEADNGRPEGKGRRRSRRGGRKNGRKRSS
jgi:hypothetical protein